MSWRRTVINWRRWPGKILHKICLSNLSENSGGFQEGVMMFYVVWLIDWLASLLAFYVVWGWVRETAWLMFAYLFCRRSFGLARFVIETCLSSYSISQFLPSQQAAASLALSCLIFYSPNTIYSSASDGGAASRPSTIAQESADITEALSDINAFSASLVWT